MRLDGTGVTKLLQGLIGVLDVAVDADAGKLYFTGPGVFRANLDGSNLEMLTPVHYAGLAWDPVSQSLFLTADNEGHIDRLDLRTGTITLIHQFPVEPLSSWLPDVAVDVINRKIYWIHSSLDRPALQRSDLDGSNLQDVLTVDPEPIGGIIGRYLTIDPSGRSVYWSAPYSPLAPEGGPGGIFRVNLDGANPAQVLNVGSNDVQGLDLGPGATTSFNTFSATLDLKLAPRIDDTFELKSPFTLGAGTNGIDLVHDAVTLALTGGTGSYVVTIPAGAFTQDKKGTFTYTGTINGVALEASISPVASNQYTCIVTGQHADLSGFTNPVTVGLTIGNDTGTTTVTATWPGQAQRGH
jgi:hypothetical protein